MVRAAKGGTRLSGQVAWRPVSAAMDGRREVVLVLKGRTDPGPGTDATSRRLGALVAQCQKELEHPIGEAGKTLVSEIRVHAQ